MNISRERLEEIAIAYGSGHHTKVNVKDDEVLQIVEALLAANEQEPVAYIIQDAEMRSRGNPGFLSYDGSISYEDKNEYEISVTPLYAHPAPVPAVPDEIEALRRDANRYRFLRDRDAFGADNEPGLVTWDEITELELNEFDSAIDARMNHPNVEWVPSGCVGDSLAELYAELYRLRAEIKGPDGFATWKDAAIAERMSKKQPKNIPGEIDYLHAMAAFGSDEWHKMSPINGYKHGWNACRAAMLNGGKS